MRNALLLTALALATTACSPWLPQYALDQGATATGYYRDIQTPKLALLEYRIADYFASRKRPYAVVCAAAARIAPHDPASQPRPLDPQVEQILLARFPGLSPLSECRRDGLDIVAASSGMAAAIIDVHEFSCNKPDECLGWAGYYANGEHGWSYYRMRFERGEWRIKRERLDIIVTGDDR